MDISGKLQIQNSMLLPPLFPYLLDSGLRDPQSRLAHNGEKTFLFSLQLNPDLLVCRQSLY
jgi:hypothetical protein